MVRNLRGVVLVASAGLDPAEVEVLRLTTDELRQAWDRLVAEARGPAAPGRIVAGRSLRYWRDFLSWRTAAPLHGGPWPLLHAWGTPDEVVPQSAFEDSAAAQTIRSAPYCALRLGGADHNLQTADGGDGVQRVWSILETWMRDGSIRCP